MFCVWNSGISCSLSCFIVMLWYDNIILPFSRIYMVKQDTCMPLKWKNGKCSWKPLRSQSCLVVSVCRQKSWVKSSENSNIYLISIYFTNVFFLPSIMFLITHILPLVSMLDPFKIKKENIPNTLSCWPREADCSATLKVPYTHRKVAGLFQPPAPFPSHLGAISPCWSLVP